MTTASTRQILSLSLSRPGDEFRFVCVALTCALVSSRAQSWTSSGYHFLVQSIASDDDDDHEAHSSGRDETSPAWTQIGTNQREWPMKSLDGPPVWLPDKLCWLGARRALQLDNDEIDRRKLPLSGARHKATTQLVSCHQLRSKSLLVLARGEL